MKNYVRVWLKRWMAMALVLAMAAGFAGCKPQEELPPEAEGRKVVYFAASYVTAQVQDAYKELIKVYNETQGVTDGPLFGLPLQPAKGALVACFVGFVYRYGIDLFFHGITLLFSV